MSQSTQKRNSFSSSIGFVLAAAGSAVGLGNIWRFPYLAAKDGGGLFLLIYLILALTFGYTMLVSEVSIGRKTKQSELTAYSALYKSHALASGGKPKKGGTVITKILGGFAAIVPFMILPYYCIIGGWVLKYCVIFCAGQGASIAENSGEYFSGFITAQYEPIIFNAVFLAAVAVIIFMGVNAIFSITINGDKHSGLDGLQVYLIPNFSGINASKVFFIVLDAMGQLFYSISVAMGIMITYGSYFKDDSNLIKSVNRIEIFDTAVAFLAGIMIIPAVFAFLGEDGLQNAGPGLMFIALPKVFAAMGWIGNIVGAVFFVMVFFAALTSAISILEAVVASIMDRFGLSRRISTIIETVIALVIGIVICLGYNILYFKAPMPNGGTAQLLDIFDYISNNILMPVVAIGTCILIGWIVKPVTIIKEATKNGEKFGRKALYIAMIKFVGIIK